MPTHAQMSARTSPHHHGCTHKIQLSGGVNPAALEQKARTKQLANMIIDDALAQAFRENQKLPVDHPGFQLFQQCNLKPTLGGGGVWDWLAKAWNHAKYGFGCIAPIFAGETSCDTICNIVLFILIAFAVKEAVLAASGVSVAAAFVAGAAALFPPLMIPLTYTYSGTYGTYSVSALCQLFLSAGATEVLLAGLTPAYLYFVKRGAALLVKKFMQRWTCLCSNEKLIQNIRPKKIGEDIKALDVFPNLESLTNTVNSSQHTHYNPIFRPNTSTTAEDVAQQQNVQNKAIEAEQNFNNDVEKFRAALDLLNAPPDDSDISVPTHEQLAQIDRIFTILRNDKIARRRYLNAEINKLELEAKKSEAKKSDASNTKTLRANIQELEKLSETYKRVQTQLTEAHTTLTRWTGCHPSLKQPSWYEKLWPFSSNKRDAKTILVEGSEGDNTLDADAVRKNTDLDLETGGGGAGKPIAGESNASQPSAQPNERQHAENAKKLADAAVVTSAKRELESAKKALAKAVTYSNDCKQEVHVLQERIKTATKAEKGDLQAALVEARAKAQLAQARAKTLEPHVALKTKTLENLTEATSQLKRGRTG